MFIRSLANDDIFISYARLDATTYAAGLADELTKRGFSCFVDMLGVEPGKELPDSLKRKIRGASMLVIVGTEKARTRQTIEDEIKEFLGTGRRTSVVPVDFEGAVYKARWYKLIEGIAPQPEKDLNTLNDGIPSPSVLGRIEKQFNYTRRNKRLRRVTVATATLLVLLIVASIAAGGYAKQQFELAREAMEQAEQARTEAREARVDAERAKAEALAARGEADRAKSAAADQERRAAVATREAQKQTRVAAIASSRAREARAVVKWHEGIAVGRKATTNAETLRAESVRSEKGWVDSLASSTLLSIEAAKRLSFLGISPAESDESLRASLNLMPRSVRSFSRAVDDVLLSSDGKYFITKEGDFVRIWDTASLTQICADIKLDDGDATFNRDRTLMALISKDKQVSIWELPSGKRRWKMGQVDEFSPRYVSELPALQFSPDGKYIAASIAKKDADENVESVHRVVVWDAKTGEYITEVEYRGRLHGIALNPGNDLLALSLDMPRQQSKEVEENNSFVQFWVIKNPASFLFESKNSNNDGPLHALSFSPNGKLLALAGNNRASILEVGGGKEFIPIEGIEVFNRGSEYINKLSFSPDGRSVGAMRRGIDVDTWDVLLGQKLWSGYYNNEGWSYEKPYIVILESGGLRVLDVTTGRDVARLFRDDLTAFGADYAPATDLLAVNFQKRVLFYDIGSAQEAAHVTFKGIEKVVYRSSDQRYVVLKDSSHRILCDTLNPGKIIQIEEGGGIDALTFSPDGTLLALLSADDELRILETRTGHEVWRTRGVPHPKLKQHGDRLSNYLTLSFSPRSGFLVLETAANNNDATVRLYSLSRQSEVVNFHTDARSNRLYEKNVSFTPDEKFVLLREANIDRIFDTETGKLIATLSQTKETFPIVLGPHNFFARSLRDTIEVSEIVSGKTVYKLKVASGISDFTFSQNGELLAAVGSEGGYIWHATTGARIASLRLNKRVNHIRFSPDGKFLVLFARDINFSPPDLVGIWNIAKGRNVVPSLNGNDILFSPDGRYAVVGGVFASSVQLLDLVTGRITNMGHDTGVMEDMAFSADGSLLAASGDRVAHVWATDSGREVAWLKHQGSIMSMAFDLDGRGLATLSDDGKARVWILTQDQLIKRACQQINQNLSHEEWRQNFRGEKYREICPNIQDASNFPQTDSP